MANPNTTLEYLTTTKIGEKGHVGSHPPSWNGLNGIGLITIRKDGKRR